MARTAMPTARPITAAGPLQAPLLAEPIGDSLVLKPTPALHPAWTWVIAISCSFSYGLSYFWRYPAFVLPASVLEEPVVSCLNLQACMSLALVAGFGAAKLPAAAFSASPFFFRHRLRALLALFTTSMLVEGVGMLAPWAAVKILAVFVSSFFSSFLYGCQLTYLEGRQTTEGCLALITMCLVYAGNASRGMGSLALQAGCSPRWMPLVVGASAWAPACALLLLTEAAPRPTALDVAARTKRGAMGPAARRRFVRQWAGGLAPMALAYALLTGLRTTRDLFSKQLFAAALGVSTAPTYIFFIVDIPGAVLSALVLLSIGSVKDSWRALSWLLAGTVLAFGLMLAATFLYTQGLLDGLEWQLLLGTGMYLAYSLLGAPFFERLLAASRTHGTISFLTFLEDLCGYVVSIAILLGQQLGPLCPGHGGGGGGGGSSNQHELETFVMLLWACAGASLVLILVCCAFFYSRRPGRLAMHAHADVVAVDEYDDDDTVHSLVIVGAGLIGSAAARHATLGAPAGSRITLVGPTEQPRSTWGDRKVFGAHHDEGRITRSTDPDPTWAVLAQRSIQRYASIEEQSGVQFFNEVGHLAVGPKGSDSLSARAANARAMAVPFEYLDHQALKARFPYLQLPQGSEAVWEPSQSGYISARRLVAAQLAAAKRAAAASLAASNIGAGSSSHPHLQGFTFMDDYDTDGEGNDASPKTPRPRFMDDYSTASLRASPTPSSIASLQEGPPLSGGALPSPADGSARVPGALATTFEHVDEEVVAVEPIEPEASDAQGVYVHSLLHSMDVAAGAMGASSSTLPLPPQATFAQRAAYRVRLSSGRVLLAYRVLVSCGAFTNGPRQLLPEPLELLNTSTQTVHFSISEAEAARLAGMPSLVLKFDHFWAYVLPPIRYPDGRVVLKLGGARVPATTSACAMPMLDTTTGSALPAGVRPLPTPEDLIAWYRSGGDRVATNEMAELLRSIVPGISPLEITSDACANCRTATGLPYIGALRPSLYVATGGNGLAAKSSDEIGRLAALAALGSLRSSEGGIQSWDTADSNALLAREHFAPRAKRRF